MSANEFEARGSSGCRHRGTGRHVGRYGRFMQPDPIGYEQGPNLYVYVNGDPVNFVDPLGLGPHDLICGGGTCADIGITSGGASGSRGTLPSGGSEAKFFLNEPLAQGGGSSGILGTVANALDAFAEKHLKPPEKRKQSETRQQCFDRIAGMSPALGTVGLFSIAAGGGWLGYVRGGFAGGGHGTSLISSAARGALGKQPVGRQIFGTGSVGGVAGRGLSKASAAGGAAAFGWAIGTAAGAVKRCQ